MTKGRKNALILLGLGALLAVCIVLYILIPQKDSVEEGEETEQTEQTEETIKVDTIDSEKITALKVTKDSASAGLELVKEGETWKLAEDRKIPLDSETVTGLFSCLDPVEATKTLDKKEDSLKEYGLDDPAMTIEVTTEDGEFRYKLGSAVPVEGGYYGLATAEDKIYCLSESLYSTFDIEENSLIKKDELPEINADYMTYIGVDNKKGKDFEAKVVSREEQVDAYSSWNITKPYGKPLATSTKTWQTTLGYFTGLAFDELVEYGSGDLKSYGLQDPSAMITVNYYTAKNGYTPEATATPSADGGDAGTDGSGGAAEIPEKYRDNKKLQLCIGKKTGEDYYVCIQGTDNVYTMSASAVESMTGIDAFDSMDHCVYSTLATDLKGYDVSYGNTVMKISHTTVKTDSAASPAAGQADSEDSDSGTKNIWKIDGKQVADEDEETFLTPYSSLYLLEYTSKAKDSVKPASQKPVLTMVYHEEDRDVTVKYLPYDGTNFYRVDRDGMDYFLVDKRSVDDAIKKFDELKKL